MRGSRHTGEARNQGALLASLRLSGCATFCTSPFGWPVAGAAGGFDGSGFLVCQTIENRRLHTGQNPYDGINLAAFPFPKEFFLLSAILFRLLHRLIGKSGVHPAQA